MTQTSAGAETASGPARLLYARLLQGQDAPVQLWFHAAVLDKYRGAGAKVLRTNTIGRLKLAQWSLDFGIAGEVAAETETAGDGTALIHLSLADARTRIPEGERAHWASHAATLPVSPNFVTLQLSRGHCVDDGELRGW